MTARPVILAAGGTGGHVVPALAVADELRARGVSVVLVTDTRGARFVPDGERLWLNVHIINAGTLRKQPLALIKDIWGMVVGLLQSFDIVRDYEPGVIVGFGGYPSFPPVFAAQILRIPTVIFGADAVLGQANKWLARFAARIAMTFPPDDRMSSKLRAKVTVTGLPLRTAIEDLYGVPYIPPTQDGPFNILITGGSQGATILGTHLARIFAAFPHDIRARLNLTHQMRAEDIDDARAVYKDAGITAHIQPFYNDIPARLKTTHLFIGRSGAGTVMDMAVAGRPAIFVPLIASTHKDAQQRDNANILVHAGGAYILEEPDLNTPNLLALLAPLMQNPAKLAEMANSARVIARLHAARALADVALDSAK